MQQQQHLLPVAIVDDDENNNGQTKILSFACTIPMMINDDIVLHDDDLFEDNTTADTNHMNDPLRDDRMKTKTNTKQQQLPVLTGNYGTIVGTITLLGRNTAMIWMSWGRSYQNTTSTTTTTTANTALDDDPPTNLIGNSSDCMMGPLVVSMSRKATTTYQNHQYQGAFAYDVPSSKLIPSFTNIENEMIATQISERLSLQLNKMAIFVSCYLDAVVVDDEYNSTILSTLDMDQHMQYRRHAIAKAEQLICERILSAIV